MAAANSNIQITDLDFDSIKTNLKTFLRGQDKFKDYDFDGSGLSVLVDILAYNTHYNALYNNLTINEMFLDSASKRSSVVSIANNFGYKELIVSLMAFFTLTLGKVGVRVTIEF